MENPNQFLKLNKNNFQELIINQLILPSIVEKLMSYQVEHVQHLLTILNTKNIALDGSDAGTGKTYCAAAICSQLGLCPIVICPKNVVLNWYHVFEQFEVVPSMITNYECAIRGKYYESKDDFNIGKRKKCPFIIPYEDKEKKSNVQYREFLWDVPENTLIIFDEAHKSKNNGKINTTLVLSSKLLLAEYVHPVKILLLSATITDKKECLKSLGIMLNLCNEDNYRQWRRSFMVHRQLEKVFDWNKLHNTIFPQLGARMSIDNIQKISKNLFKENDVQAKSYPMDCADEIEQIYVEMTEDIRRLKLLENISTGWGAIIRARQRIELLKVPQFVELAKKYLRKNNSVVIFINYKDTASYISSQIGNEPHLFIDGEQDGFERQQVISKFQNDEVHLLICNIMAGGIGISLHDLLGQYPRVSIISPTWTSIDLKQALGRIHRANAKSNAKQRIVYCKDTVEEDICKLVNKKIKNIDTLNDGDLSVHDRSQ